jgi:hypothetical protein
MEEVYVVLPAPTLETILQNPRRPHDDSGRRLVSILMATPDTASFTALRDNFAYFNTRSGISWDLYVAGYYAYGGARYDRQGFPVGIFMGRETEWWFSPQQFEQLRGELEEKHRRHTSRSGFFRRRTPWRYSGTPEIVNLWSTKDTPDWNSLASHPLTEATPLARVVETHTDWAGGQLPDGFRPGKRPHVVGEELHIDSLRRGLSWAIAGAAGAALSEGVNALIDELTRH